MDENKVVGEGDSLDTKVVLSETPVLPPKVSDSIVPEIKDSTLGDSQEDHISQDLNVDHVKINESGTSVSSDVNVTSDSRTDLVVNENDSPSDKISIDEPMDSCSSSVGECPSALESKNKLSECVSPPVEKVESDEQVANLSVVSKSVGGSESNLETDMIDRALSSEVSQDHSSIEDTASKSVGDAVKDKCILESSEYQLTVSKNTEDQTVCEKLDKKHSLPIKDNKIECDVQNDVLDSISNVDCKVSIKDSDLEALNTDNNELEMTSCENSCDQDIKQMESVNVDEKNMFNETVNEPNLETDPLLENTNDEGPVVGPDSSKFSKSELNKDDVSENDNVVRQVEDSVNDMINTSNDNFNISVSGDGEIDIPDNTNELEDVMVGEVTGMEIGDVGLAIGDPLTNTEDVAMDTSEPIDLENPPESENECVETDIETVIGGGKNEATQDPENILADAEGAQNADDIMQDSADVPDSDIQDQEDSTENTGGFVGVCKDVVQDSEDAVLDSEDALLGSGDAVLGSGDAVLGSEDAVLSSGDAVLNSGDALSDSENIRLGIEGAVTGSEELAPDSEDTVLGSEDAIKSCEDTMPGSEDAIKSCEDTMPGSEDATRDEDNPVQDSKDTVQNSEDSINNSEYVAMDVDEAVEGDEVSSKPGDVEDMDSSSVNPEKSALQDPLATIENTESGEENLVVEHEKPIESAETNKVEDHLQEASLKGVEDDIEKNSGKDTESCTIEAEEIAQEDQHSESLLANKASDSNSDEIELSDSPKEDEGGKEPLVEEDSGENDETHQPTPQNLSQNDEEPAGVISENENKIDNEVDAKESEEVMEVDLVDENNSTGNELDGTCSIVENCEGIDVSAMCETVIEESGTSIDLANITSIHDSSASKKAARNLPLGRSKEESRKQGRTSSSPIRDEEICIIPDSVPKTKRKVDVKTSDKPVNDQSVNEQNKSVGVKEVKADAGKVRKFSKPTEVEKLCDGSPPSPASEPRRTPGRPQRQAAKRAECQIKEIAADEEEAEETNVRSCDYCYKLRSCITSLRFQENGIEKIKFFCTNECALNFKRATKAKHASDSVGANAADPAGRFTRKCSQCMSYINGDEHTLSWETMDYCNEECLGKYQKVFGSQCANCKGTVAGTSLGKYCVRFGYDVKQFCCSGCLEEFKKGLKLCSYCLKDISGGSEGFLAPVGDKGQFKDFCTQSCMEKYDQMSNHNAPPVVVQECAVCNNEKVVAVEVLHADQVNKFCSEPCFAAFKFVNGMDPGQCFMCKKYFDKKVVENFSVYSDDSVHSFCSKTCMNVYILANRKIVPCHWCKVKKYNFDMIKKTLPNGQSLLVCSLNCLSLFEASNGSRKRLKCDMCSANKPPQYQLHMTDNSSRNFCTYQCAVQFQEKYSNSLGVVPTPVPADTSKSNGTSAFPVISSVQSLASDGAVTNNSGVVTRSSGVKVPNSSQAKVVRQIIVRPPAPKQMRNKAISCRPPSHTKGTHCRPILCTKETQTDDQMGKPVLIPVPVPIYVPAPMCMYSNSFPIPVPFPLPVPVPIFIPTTRNSAKGIMKEIKKIQEKIPADPFEAELLMMAEIVAGEKKEDNSDSDSDGADNAASGTSGVAGLEEASTAAGTTEERYTPDTVDASNTFGDDMLQMALKMATELEEPTDLEAALTPSTITPQPQSTAEHQNSESEDDPEPAQPIQEARSSRGRKRSIRMQRSTATSSPSSAPNKRRRIGNVSETQPLPPPEPQPQHVEQEKPDANMCLKYTLGVNAWKRWVLTKNAELEKAAASNRKLKLFKTEILQQTADELNYSLCLFVKEVRKPSGQEYAPDTIYYLCLGIQQYLFENGRIDNIFTDPYYEKFTECLDEVAKKFATLYNDSQYIVTRVEEEHLWESKQLGAHSPHVLLSTLMFFNTKHFNLTTVEEHMQLSFSHIMKHWKRNPNQSGSSKGPGGSRNVLLRFYPPQSALDANSKKKKVYEQQENEENPLRCPVKLYEFYLSKCPESVKTRNDVFYLLPERSCVPDSPVWYSTMALGKEPLMKMLHRVKMVKEINQALLKS